MNEWKKDNFDDDWKEQDSDLEEQYKNFVKDKNEE